MLPVPIDKLMAQPMQYQPSNPPAMMQFNIPPQFQSYTSGIAAAMANELSAKAQGNFIRVFVFNLVSQNNWQNQYYQEAVSISGYLMAWTARQSGPQAAISNIMGITLKAVEMFIAKCIIAHPDIHQYIDQGQFTAAQQSCGQLENLMMEVNQMYQQPAPNMQYQQPMQQPMQQQAPMMPYMNPAMQPQMAPSVGFTGSGISFGTTQQFGMPAMPQQNVSASNVDVRYGGRQKNVEIVAHASSIPMKPVAPIPVTQPTNEQGGKMPTSLREVESMDRNQHTLHYGNNAVGINRSKREFLATERVENLGKDLKPVKPENLQVLVHNRTLIQSSFDELISESRVIQQQNKLDDKESGVFRANGVVATLFITAEDYGNELRNVVQGDTLVKITERLAALYRTTGAKEASDKIRCLVMLERLNQRLTWFVNQFVRVEMDLGVTIESFMDDAGELPSFIVNKFGPSYVQHLDYMTTIINNAFMPNIQEAEQMLRSALLDDTGVAATFVMESVSLTLIDLMYKELGYDLKPNTSYQISDDQQLLYLLAKKIDYGNPMEHLVEHNNYLITLDDVKLTLHRSLVNPDQYLIALA